MTIDSDRQRPVPADPFRGGAEDPAQPSFEHALLEALIDGAHDGIIVIDQHDRILRWNAAAERIFGHAADAAIGRDIHDLVAPTQRRGGVAERLRLFDPDGGAQIGRTLELSARRRNGTPIEIELSLSAMPVAGRWHGLAVVRDISERRRLQEAMARSERNFHSLVQMNRSGMLILDRDGRIRFANTAAQQLLNRSGDELLGLAFGIPSTERSTEIGVLRKDGSRGTAEMTATETEWEGEAAHLITLHDITPLKDAEARARFLARHDTLPGLPNRRRFRERLEEVLAANGGDGMPLALLYLDLDRFKPINDRFGHAMGDRVLRIVAERLAGCLRSSDMVARLGGDELCALLPGIRRRRDLAVIASKIIAAVSAPMRLDGNEITVGTSIGIAMHPEHGRDADTLLRGADQAMYIAKRSGIGFSFCERTAALLPDDLPLPAPPPANPTPWSPRMTDQVLRLFICGNTPEGETAIRNLEDICARELGGRYRIEVIDVLDEPAAAEDARIIATPTLVKALPPPLRRIIGDLSDRERVLVGLDLVTPGGDGYAAA